MAKRMCFIVPLMSLQYLVNVSSKSRKVSKSPKKSQEINRIIDNWNDCVTGMLTMQRCDIFITSIKPKVYAEVQSYRVHFLLYCCMWTYIRARLAFS